MAEQKGKTSGWLVLLAVLAVGGLAYAAFGDGGSTYGDGDDTSILGPLLLVAVVCGFIGGAIGGSKRMGGGSGFFLGFLLGPLGLLIVVVSESASPTRVVVEGVVAPSAPVRSLAPPMPGTPAGWMPDPTGRFEHRYWDGSRWTEHVVSNDQQTTDQP